MTIIYNEISVGELSFIQRTNTDGSISTIPTDPANSDYQRYLKWLDDPNAPTAFLHQPLVEG
jgi:hypothetical protein